MGTNQSFKTVVIGTQEWMAQNLNVSIEDSWCRSDDPDGTKFGRFYTWESARRACPQGWHLPSDAEWGKLVNQLGGEDVAGEKLKEGGSSGFEAKLRGNRVSSGQFEFAGSLANFWTSTEHDGEWAWCRFLNSRSLRVGHDKGMKKAGYAVRCVKDATNTSTREGSQGWFWIVNFLRNLFGNKQSTIQSSESQPKQPSQPPPTTPSFVVSEVRELPLQKLSVSYEGTPSEISQSYSHGHQSLEPLLDNITGIVNRDKAMLFFKKLNIDAPGEYSSPYELFKSTISLITIGSGKTTLEAWAITEQSLGAGPNVLVVFIDIPTLPTTLVCCRIGPGNYLARYADGSIPQLLGL